MKNTLLMIKQLFIATRKKILIFESVILGGFTLGLILALIGSGISEDKTFINLGGFMALIFFAIEIFFGLVFTCTADFVLAITNGKGRVDFLVARYVIYVAEFLVGIGIIKLGGVIETAIGEKFFNGMDFFSVPTFSTLLAGALVIPTLCMLMSALYTRFERKAFWVLWVIWMAVSLGAPRIATAMRKAPDSFAAKIGFFFKSAISMGTTQFFIVAAVIGVVAFVLNFFVYRYLEAKL